MLCGASKYLPRFDLRGIPFVVGDSARDRRLLSRELNLRLRPEEAVCFVE